MSKLRVHELAKEFNITNRELLEKLIELDVDVKNHMSGVDDETVYLIKKEQLAFAPKLDRN